MLDKIADKILATLVLDGKKNDLEVAKIWAKLFKDCSYETFDEIWANIAATRMPTKIEILCALAGFNPHEDWMKITQVISGECEEHTICGVAYAALKKAGGLGKLRDSSSYDAEQMRKTWWDNLEVGGNNAIMPAPVIISLRANGRVAHDIEAKYPIDYTGQMRGTALLNCLDDGAVSPRTAALLCRSLPTFWRDSVLNTCEAIEVGSSRNTANKNSWKIKQTLQKVGSIDAEQVLSQSVRK